MIDFAKEKFKEGFSELVIKRSLANSGVWETKEIMWANIPLVTDDAIIRPEIVLESLSPVPQLENYKMYFFAEGYSKDNVGGDRLLVHMEKKKGFSNNPQIDELVKKGIIESSTEYAGKNFQEWAKENGYQITSLSANDLNEILLVTPEMLQKAITALNAVKGKFKLIPAARDMKSTSGQRLSLLESSLLQAVTSTSIDRQRQAEVKWEKYKGYIERLLKKRMEPNPSQVLLKEGNLGLLPAQIGGGEQSMMGIVWETMDADAIFAVEEPENHLHPKLQRDMFDYFRELSQQTQVLICTHGAIFASKPSITGVYLVSKDEDGATHVEQVNEENISRIVDELGIRASDVFDYDIIVFVEGFDDVKIYNSLARRLLRDTDETIGFIDAEGWNSMAYYANARILKSRRISVRVSAVFDGDTEREEKNKKIKERLVKELNLEQSCIHTLARNSIEAYLLVPAAIKRAFPQIRLSELEIATFIRNNELKQNKKEVLRLLLKRGGVDAYDGEVGAQIVQAMKDEEIELELKQMFTTLARKSIQTTSAHSS
jgi:energy-coupling factor transporter ATP-binding protein EcfA2